MASGRERVGRCGRRVRSTMAGAGIHGALVAVLVAGGTLVAPELAQAQQRRVFMTSTTHMGNLGGLAGAEAVCTARATAATLGGTWVAWLSTATVNAKDRLTAGSGPFVRASDAVKIADDIADLTSGLALDSAILKDETGATPAFQLMVYTGTMLNGTIGNGTCADWTSANAADQGVAGLNDDPSFWSDDLGGGPMCDSAAPIYCFEVATPTPAPTVVAISPSSGPANTSTTVTITGTDFVAGSTVTHGSAGTGFTCGSVSVTSATSLTCATANSVAAGSHRFIVTSPNGSSAASTATFTFVSAVPPPAPGPPPPPPAVERTLTISVVGNGTITSAPPGIDCPGTCIGRFSSAATVTLVPHPGTGWMFQGMTGDCTGLTVEMTSNKSCTATFSMLDPGPTDPESPTDPTFDLTLTVDDGLRVTSEDGKIDCPETECRASYPEGEHVALHVETTSPGFFAGWQGPGCADGLVTMNADTSCRAVFASECAPVSQTRGGAVRGRGAGGTHYEIEIIQGEVFIAVWDGAVDVTVEVGSAESSVSFGEGEDFSYAKIGETGEVTRLLEPPENFEPAHSEGEVDPFFGTRPCESPSLATEPEGSVVEARIVTPSFPVTDTGVVIPLGSEVKVFAVPGPGFALKAIGGDPDCADGRVTLGRSVACEVVFEEVPTDPTLPGQRQPVTLQIYTEGAGSGTVASVPAGITACGAASADAVCHMQASGPVQLTATADAASSFLSWIGHPDCIEGVIDGAGLEGGQVTCGAVFAPRPPSGEAFAYQVVEVTVAGPGSGTVSSGPPGLHVRGVGQSGRFVMPFANVVPVLGVRPDVGSTFVGFSGDPDCVDGVITSNARLVSCVATFGLGPPVDPVPGPLDLTMEHIGDAVSLFWRRTSAAFTPPGHAAATSYLLEVGSAPGAADLVTLELRGSSATFQAPPGDYVVAVRGMTAAGLGPRSNEVAFSSPCTGVRRHRSCQPWCRATR